MASTMINYISRKHRQVGVGFRLAPAAEGKGEFRMFRKCTGMVCAMLLLLALFTLPAARTALAGDNDAAKIGDKTYETLAGAVASVTDGTATTITLLRDASGDGIIIASGRNITIDLNNHTYTIDGNTVGSSGTETNGFQLLKGANVTIKDGKITSTKAKILIQNYCNLTLHNVVLDGRNLVGSAYTLSLNCGKIQITGNTSILAKTGGVAFDLYYWPKGGYSEGVQVTVDTTGTISGPIELDEDGKEGAAGAADKNSLTIQNVRLEGTISNKLGEYDTKVVSVSGGIFSETPLKYTDDTVVSTGGDFYVGKQADEVLLDPATKEVTVLQAKGSLTARDGVKVINSTGSAITVNGQKVEPGNPSEIHNMKAVAAKDPTCNEQGNSAYWVCQSCGLVTDANGKVLSAVPTIPAKGHNYQDGVCTVCGASENAAVPETGDGANPLLWFALLLTAAGGALLCREVRRRFNG